ncbi:MAG: hypothetical protein NXI13_03170 [Proteobacteria bacterium]|nr:hypothetical protein [Pseudomonadota bacterium]
MKESEFIDSLLKLLEGVVSGLTNYIELQKFADSSITNDGLPEDQTGRVRQLIYNLQSDLELIAVHQSEQLGSIAFYSRGEIANRLKGYLRDLSE